MNVARSILVVAGLLCTGLAADASKLTQLQVESTQPLSLREVEFGRRNRIDACLFRIVSDPFLQAPVATIIPVTRVPAEELPTLPGWSDQAQGDEKDSSKAAAPFGDEDRKIAPPLRPPPSSASPKPR